MQEKTRVSDYQYKQYLRSLLGDKEDEKVLDVMTKVEKALRVRSLALPREDPVVGIEVV